MRTTIASLALLLCRGRAYVHLNGRYPENADICRQVHHNSGHPEREQGCREALAGGLHCRDVNYCVDSAYECKDEDVARRSGMVCEGWPCYNGGYPLSQIHWAKEDEFYECAVSDEGMAAEYCERWLTLEDSKEEWEAGDCQCHLTDTDAGKEYCKQWSCEQIEVGKCINGDDYVGQGNYRWDSGWRWGGFGWEWRGAPDTNWLQLQFPGYTTTRRGRWDQFPYQCLRHDKENDRRYINGPDVEIERSECECRDVLNGHCQHWYCEEFDDAGRHDTEYENYHVTQFDEVTGTVTAWTGNIDSKSEFEFSRCECTELAPNGLFCRKWQCDEKGHAYFYPNLLWSMLNLAFVIPPFLIGCSSGGDPCVWTLVFLWAALWSLLFVWLGGIGELVIVASICVGPLILFPCIFGCCDVYEKSKIRGNAFSATRKSTRSYNPGDGKRSFAGIVTMEEAGIGGIEIPSL